MIRLIRDELLIIVGTSSSETVLPRLLAKLQAAGASKQVIGMVIPTGYSFNLDGTCIYLTLGALFIVQATGQDMAIGEQIALAGLMILTSKGAAGITGAGLVTLTASLQAFGGTFFSRRVDRRRHRARGRDRPDHERGPRADQRDRQLGGDDGDRAAGRASCDEERFQQVLRDPSIVDAEVERAMLGADDDETTSARPLRARATPEI